LILLWLLLYWLLLVLVDINEDDETIVGAALKHELLLPSLETIRTAVDCEVVVVGGTIVVVSDSCTGSAFCGTRMASVFVRRVSGSNVVL